MNIDCLYRFPPGYLRKDEVKYSLSSSQAMKLVLKFFSTIDLRERTHRKLMMCINRQTSQHDRFQSRGNEVWYIEING